ncbi:Brp/Blh family beta-carotene 15,15'-dioxygenase [Hymenobacter armeniacus]|uniref:Probable beta-carotene 15,15'-dioxygenase n=1 Tax=Hymenobacter armeniacus TaxID=2771358 RepID=A0ABR8JYY0_9BACT|nr:Brp/Blh family beta-carotene 15,15'-dioxygenase [Hymenobacter armeniacus]MBD2724400.1 Brp/Blh family beta-carotene 15,15'-dioxygenase [Hymenobacter armeniacus]
MLFAPAPADWLRRRYSYAAVLALTGLGLAFPAAADVLLGLPLAVGMVVLGVAHGACDHWVVPARTPGGSKASGRRYWLRFLTGYLGLAALVGGLWWQWPAATVGVFFVLTVWHWGSADAPTVAEVPRTWWLAHSLLRGLLLFAVPAWRWPAETADVVNGLLTFAGAPALVPAALGGSGAGMGLVVAGGHLALWALYARARRWELLAAELLEVAVLLALFVAVPPRLAVGVYFVFWHSLQHVLRMNRWLGYPAAGPRLALLPQLAFFWRRAAPLLLVSCLGLLGLGYALAGRLPNATAWFSLALVLASVVTLPHALLVTLVMDAPRRPTAG